jgi:hypothetical protein
MTTDGYICSVGKSQPSGSYNNPLQMKQQVKELLGVCTTRFMLLIS